MKIGLLGGTFDPVHLGHLTLARNAQVQFSLDKVLFIPAYDPPHKREVPPVASAEDRFAMVRLAVKDEPFFEISDVEVQRKGPSYTCDTIAELEKRYPQAVFCLILGIDSLQGFEAWHRAAEIKRKVRFLVAQRGTAGGAGLAGASVEWIRMPLCPIAASAIRESFAAGGGPGDQVPLAVSEFIRSRHLYRKKNP